MMHASRSTRIFFAPDSSSILRIVAPPLPTTTSRSSRSNFIAICAELATCCLIMASAASTASCVPTMFAVPSLDVTLILAPEMFWMRSMFEPRAPMSDGAIDGSKVTVAVLRQSARFSSIWSTAALVASQSSLAPTTVRQLVLSGVNSIATPKSARSWSSVAPPRPRISWRRSAENGISTDGTLPAISSSSAVTASCFARAASTAARASAMPELSSLVSLRIIASSNSSILVRTASRRVQTASSFLLSGPMRDSFTRSSVFLASSESIFSAKVATCCSAALASSFHVKTSSSAA
mmetsp:Transcript_11512/g.35746  ORF Transcript_11512/g.35746 Transcript_11512/m.35746 type:complete len:294 (+) Transcript_11512:1671-2552(+)